MFFDFDCIDKYAPFINWKDASYLGGIGEEEIEEETIGQYTGLHDKMKKEIYEGDIVCCREYIGGDFVEYYIERGIVRFKDGEFGLQCLLCKQSYYQSLRKFIEYGYELEVLGNIYENADLLERSKYERENRKIKIY